MFFRKELSFILIFLVCFWLASSSFAETLLEEGKALFESGQYSQAKEKLSEYLKTHPDDPQALFYLGKVEQDGVKSQEYFKRVLEEHPEANLADDALFQIAQFYYAEGYYLTSRQQFLHLLENYPKSKLTGKAQYWVASTYLATEEFDQAKKEFKKLLDKYSKDNDLKRLGKLGVLDTYYLQGNYRKAISLAKELLRKEDFMDFMGSHIYRRLAECYKEKGQKDSLEKVIERLKSEYPNSYEAQNIRDFLAQEKSSPQDSSKRYFLQAGAFENIANATTMHNKLAAQNIQVRLKTKIINEKLLYLVWMGPYKTKKQALKTAKELKRSYGIKCLLREAIQ